MLRILPLASSLNPPDQVAATVGRIGARLSARDIAHRITAPGEGAPDALLILTGGTEHLALSAAEHMADPVFLLAHADQNSFPAALEILSRLRQADRSGRILLLTDTGGGDAGLARLARHLELRRQMNGLRLARIGKPSDWLVASTPDPSIVTSTWGPEVIDISLDEVVEAMGSVSNADASAMRAEVAGSARAVVEPSAGDLDVAARVAAALRQVVDRHRADACTIRCFDLVVNQRTTGCLALSRLSDEGVTAGCEGDVPATLTMMWMRALTGAPAFVANPQDLDPATNTLWLAHCTVPRSLVSGYVLRSHFESSLGVGIQGRFEPGPATVARIGGSDLRDVFVSDGEIVGSGNNPWCCRTQVEVRLQSDVRLLLDRPVGNHHVLALGHLGETLREYHALFVAKPE